MPKYPKVKVQLSGKDGNVFAIISHVQEALDDAGVSQDEISSFFAEVESSESYHAALAVVQKWVSVS